jgi:hypothetical protein
MHPKFPPTLILFEPEGGSQISSVFVDNRNHGGFAIPEGHIPITPSSVTFSIVLKDGTKLSICRSQYTLTGEYAFTDLKVKLLVPC